MSPPEGCRWAVPGAACGRIPPARDDRQRPALPLRSRRAGARSRIRLRSPGRAARARSRHRGSPRCSMIGTRARARCRSNARTWRLRHRGAWPSARPGRSSRKVSRAGLDPRDRSILDEDVWRQQHQPGRVAPGASEDERDRRAVAVPDEHRGLDARERRAAREGRRAPRGACSRDPSAPPTGHSAHSRTASTRRRADPSLPRHRAGTSSTARSSPALRGGRPAGGRPGSPSSSTTSIDPPRNATRTSQRSESQKLTAAMAMASTTSGSATAVESTMR